MTSSALDSVGCPILAAPLSTTLLDRLRAETRPAHEAIEQALDWERRVADIEAYRHLLARLYGFHRIWEPQAAALIADPVFFDPRRKQDRLAADLQRLGLTSEAIEALPPALPHLLMTTPEDALGAMYVLEGSTLGGQLIARRVTETLGTDIGDALRYHRSYGKEVGPMWQAFRTRLLAHSSPDTDDQILRSADRTFIYLRYWLCGA